ncbi:MAG: Panacea domain-containing protein [Terriglobia bacterium]
MDTPKAKRWPENEERFRELILYVSQKCANDPRFGTVKLNKILFLSDFLAFAHYREPITGFEYQKLEQGPAPRRLLPVRERIIEAKELGLQEIPLRNGNVQIRTVNLRRPNLAVFEPEHISVVDAVIEALSEAGTDAVLTHKMVGWKAGRFGETIPYETIFLTDEPLTEADIERGREIAAEFGLALQKT